MAESNNQLGQPGEPGDLDREWEELQKGGRKDDAGDGENSNSDDDSGDDNQDQGGDSDAGGEKPKDDQGAKQDDSGDGKGDDEGGKQKGSEDGGQQKPPVEPPKRPTRHIPIPKYTQEKKEWQETVGQKDEEIGKLQGEIDDLKKQLAGKGTDGQTQAQVNEKITAWAQKNGFELDQVTELVGIVREQLGDIVPKEKLDMIDKVAEQSAEKQDEINFNTEFDDEVVPIITKEFPNASKDALSKVKKDLDEISHTEGNETTLLRHLFHDNRERYAEMLNTPKKKSAESGSMGKKESGISLEEIYAMEDGDEKSKIIDAFSDDEYENYVAYVRQQEGSMLEHRRDGKLVKE